MRHHITTNILLLLMLIAALSSCSDSGDSVMETALNNAGNESPAGGSLTQRQCGGCHSLDGSFRKVGPSLKGIFGRAPKISAVPFTVWDEEALDQWIENPKRVKPRTSMAIPGNKSATERAAIIEYLKQI